MNYLLDRQDLYNLDKNEIIELLQLQGDDFIKLIKKANEIRLKYRGDKVYFRGLIEYSNICRKNCLYCGIRSGNKNFIRYTIKDDEFYNAVKFAIREQYGSIVIQSGENTSPAFIEKITEYIKEIKKISNGKLGITLSLGEQSMETYQKWYDAGAHRYLLRIEESHPELYKKLHPQDGNHDFETRYNCLINLQNIGYQLGTGIMIGLPFQTVEHLADDLIFMRELDIDMCGMGPYIEHPDTPLYQYKDELLHLKDRFNLTLKMIAILRLMMPDINIAATTAMQAIDPMGREKALQAGANVLMPNITPKQYREEYLLYNNKPCKDENPDDCITCLDSRVEMAGYRVGYDEWGDSAHYFNRKKL
ncbi:MAG TPA: [FeFe] hydrogenase H-cluster radical SAM maturase HydE [Bacteroidales bacterium]|nr:[FeFe] hydrogenase H-cluster radical SAM maturase HydE [Bacteroidales bacterium]